jgi:hypothetical protein
VILQCNIVKKTEVLKNWKRWFAVYKKTGSIEEKLRFFICFFLIFVSNFVSCFWLAKMQGLCPNIILFIIFLLSYFFSHTLPPPSQARLLPKIWQILARICRQKPGKSEILHQCGSWDGVCIIPVFTGYISFRASSTLNNTGTFNSLGPYFSM